MFICLFFDLSPVFTTESPELVGEAPLLFIVLGIFLLIGIVLMIKGIKKIIIDKKTSKHGEESYAIIKNIFPTGSSVNGVPELKGVFQVYVLSTNSTETVEEVIGFNPLKYQINNYVKVKYYNGDINILEKLADDDVPESVKKYIGVLETNSFGKVEDIIHVNGHTYKRID